MSNLHTTLDRTAAALDLCHRLEVQPTSIEVDSTRARLWFEHADLTGTQRRAVKRHFGAFTKSSFSGDIFSEPDADGILAFIRAAYECRTVCVAQRAGAEDYEMPGETVAK